MSTDPVIVADVPQASYYLDRSHDIFHACDSDGFENVARNEGTVDFWSGQRLLSTDDELRRYTAQSSIVLVLRRRSRRGVSSTAARRSLMAEEVTTASDSA